MKAPISIGCGLNLRFWFPDRSKSPLKCIAPSRKSYQPRNGMAGKHIACLLIFCRSLRVDWNPGKRSPRITIRNALDGGGFSLDEFAYQFFTQRDSF